jgi:uncharacterized protein (DUF1697 family)
VTRYVAFLRGINVGGRQTVKMAELCQRFEGLGFARVSAYRASGNIRFETTSAKEAAIRVRLERGLRERFGDRLEVLLRSANEIQEVIRLDPFRTRPSPSAVAYVTFVPAPVQPVPRLPIRSPRSDTEVFRVHRRDVFSWALPGDASRTGFPNAFIEKLFGQPATTRNWSTVIGVVTTVAVQR